MGKTRKKRNPIARELHLDPKFKPLRVESNKKRPPKPITVQMATRIMEKDKDEND